MYTPDTPSFSWMLLCMQLLGGVAFFFFGIDATGKGLQKAAGKRLRYMLSVLTNRRWPGFLLGAFTTAAAQSSTFTTVLLVSFVQGRLMSFGQTLAVILGADFGTTLTAQLVAFNVTEYALWAIAFGYGFQLLRRPKWSNGGEILMGIGLIFFGMKLMSSAMLPLQELPWVIDLLKSLNHPLLGVLAGTLVTGLIHSSAAFIGLVILLAQQDLIDLQAGISLILGANIGTCFTAMLASIGTNREAKRVALAHVLFKLTGVALFVFWIPSFAQFIIFIGGKVNSSMARDIANAHTLFNLIIGIIFFPFLSVIEKFLLTVFPVKAELRPVNKVHFIDPTVISTPTIALDLGRKELSHMSEVIGDLLEPVMKIFTERKLGKDKTYPEMGLLEAITYKEQQIDFLEEEITQYLLKIAQQPVSNDVAKEVFSLISIAKDLESIGDIIQKNIVPLSFKKHNLEVDFSKEGREELRIYHIKICKQISRLKMALAEIHPEKAQKIMKKMDAYLKLEDTYRIQHLKRLRSEIKQSIETHEVHMELLDYLKQINVYVGNIAHTLSSLAKPVEVELAAE